ncbi:MAG: trypsin-like peptidase domain-containing protein [Anaerolineaceae bacterium]|nr:trypsin-like peptidase domain-containing protein [Anaerolineaceae bacterium]MDE0327835.1 trypsin-like peptidase domain-containing protein [Anaerolineaceae bacterium]
MNPSPLRRLLLALLPLFLIIFGFALGSVLLPGQAAPVLQVIAPPPTPDFDALEISGAESEIARLYVEVSPSVVSINVAVVQRGSVESVSGSGFVISDQGHIVTNTHVIEDAMRDGIEVNFLDGAILRAQIVGMDRDSDLAVLQVSTPPEQLRPLVLADSDRLVIGQTALAIGSPFGQRWTLTRGIISALDRTIRGLGSFSIGSVIQTDAAINQGNSGGPLFNLRGEVIGVNSQIVTGSRLIPGNAGVGFAIPSNLVRRVTQDLIRDGEVRYSFLGISAIADEERSISLNLMETLNLPNNLRGVVIGAVTPGGPAERAGLRNAGEAVRVRGQRVPTSADIITSIDGVPVHDMSSLISWMAIHTRPGDEVTLSIWRDGAPMSMPVTLGERP